MSQPNLSVAGLDAGHEYPIKSQGNLAHVPVRFDTSSQVNGIIKSGAPTVGHSENPVWQFPADNRANATKLAA